MDTLCGSLPVDRPSEKELALTDDKSVSQHIVHDRHKVLVVTNKHVNVSLHPLLQQYTLPGNTDMYCTSGTIKLHTHNYSVCAIAYRLWRPFGVLWGLAVIAQ